MVNQDLVIAYLNNFYILSLVFSCQYWAYKCKGCVYIQVGANIKNKIGRQAERATETDSRPTYIKKKDKCYAEKQFSSSKVE